jgi:predicted DNA-binding transcriptional regulator YafY
MDILKYGADCTVVSPIELKARVTGEIQKMVAAYGM